MRRALLLVTLAACAKSTEGASASTTPRPLPAASSAPATTTASSAASASIGSATMRADGTIVLQLRAEGARGEVGDGYFEYPPSHKDYKKILDHVGPLAPGESKPVRPFP